MRAYEPIFNLQQRSPLYIDWFGYNLQKSAAHSTKITQKVADAWVKLHKQAVVLTGFFDIYLLSFFLPLFKQQETA